MTANDITVNVTNGNTASANFINQPTSVTIKKVDENNHTIYINGVAVFGGVEIK